MKAQSIVPARASFKIYAAALTFAWFLVDQATKTWILERAMTSPDPKSITPFLNLVLGWNKGISFGMLGGHDLPPWTLALLSGGVAAGLSIWMLRTHDRLVATGLALIIGGALGNALDRIRHGAVADFLDFHLTYWHWPAFNLADVGIVCGGTLLLTHSCFRQSSLSA